MLLQIAKIICGICFSAALAYSVNLFWIMFYAFSNDDEIPDKPLRPDYIVKELTAND